MERIFYNTQICEENLPIYIFDTSFLPSPEDVNFDEFIMTMMARLPSNPYILIMFSNGLNKISWIWGLKFLKKFLVDEINLNNVVRILSVHDSWFIKTLTNLMNNYNLTRQNLSLLTVMGGTNLSSAVFNDKEIINCSNLLDLNQYVDVTKLKISLNVYKYDYSINDCDSLTNFKNPKFSTSNPHYVNDVLKYHFYQIFNIIYKFGPQVELIFHKPGNKVNSEIFINCIKRDQLIWINDWDLYCIATSFKKLIGELPTLLPIELIQLPLTRESLQPNFHEILNTLNPDLKLVLINVFKLLFKLINNPHTKLDSKILSRIFIPCLSHQPCSKSNESSMLIVGNFIRKVLDNWDQFDFDREYVEERSDDTYLGFDLSKQRVASPQKDESPQRSESSQRSESPQRNSPIRPLRPLPPTPSRVTGKLDTLSRDNLSRDIPSSENLSKDSLHNMISSPTKIKPTHNPTKFKSPSPTKLSPTKKTPKSPLSPSKSINSYSYSPLKPKPLINSYNGTAIVTPSSLSLSPSKIIAKKVSTMTLHSETNEVQVSSQNIKRPVIRGIKVGELARLYEERAQGLQLLKSL